MYSGDDITVLMSIYSKSKLDELKTALYSVFSQQSVRPKAILIVEDGPVSEEVELFLIDMAQMVPLKIISLEKNVGLALALQEGLKKVDTVLVARMDSDDISVPNRFELQLKEFNLDPKLAVVGGSVSEFSRTIGDAKFIRQLPEHDEAVRRFSKFRSPFNHPTVMMKTAEIKKVGGYKSLGKLEDYFLWVRLLTSKEITVLNLPEILVHMRAGQSLYQRRGGSSEMIQHFWILRRYMLQEKQLNYVQFIVSMTTNAISILISPKLRMSLYSLFLRKKL
ncbi:glycosyltransferase [Weissella confusa]|uniref:Glycosyltransferase n=2 Tax=Weissella confusa TaxID=1583 RepID=A0AA40YXB0_WEICO|nr:glycosyltransferase [Weissella confusa]MBJ7639943.1 glycosyltransferase [Weissella confusa]